MEERVKRIIGKILDLKEVADREINDKYFAGQAVGLNFVLGLIYDEFPELAESEDERIRKIITDSVFYQYGADVEYKDVLDYLDKLEKHKKSLHISETCKENADSFTDEDEKMMTWLITQLKTNYKGNYWAGKAIAYLEKQKEQKPAEWSEEDETCLENALWCVEKTRHFVAKDACDFDACRSAKRLLESLPERFNLQPKQEWSEEQMEALRRAINKLAKSDVADSVRLSIMYDNLKKLK